MRLYKLILVLLLTWVAFSGAPALAQTAAETANAASSQVEMADVMRQDGKIYIVVAVLVTVLLGILFYLISLDKKVARLEREVRQ